VRGGLVQIPYTPPEYKGEAFNCPHCNAFADQEWYTLSGFDQVQREWVRDPHVRRASCRHCRQPSYWFDRRLFYPPGGGPPPNPDLLPEIIDDYNEARRIVNDSPRGAAALLRLCLQKLMVQLDEKGENLNEDIASLVQRGLPVEIQRALDIVRVIGNNAVHPGELDIKDDLPTAMSLFELVNQIAESMISQPKKIEDLYGRLPESKRKAIEERDKKPGATTKSKKK